jgi:glycerol-3-phosphate dehydrogenase (NAD(P)+)
VTVPADNEHAASPMGGPVAVLGGGSWGTALAVQLARAGRGAVIWARDDSQAADMRRAGRNTRYLPDVAFPPGLTVTSDLRAAVQDANAVLIAVPSTAFRRTLEALRDLDVPLPYLAWATKGFELDTGLLPHEVVRSVLGDAPVVAVLSGPTFAREVGLGLPSAMTVAAPDLSYAGSFAAAISTDVFRAYTSADMLGVEIGGATKNVYAIGAGISDGLGFGANSRIALVTRALSEMTRLGAALGAHTETFMGLAGMGDLVLTCTDDQSRNRRFGLALGHGQTPEAALRDIGQVVEGYYAARAVRQVAHRLGVEMPIVEQIHGVIYEAIDPRDAVNTLMRRPLAAELR